MDTKVIQRAVAPPSRSFHVVCAPGQANGGPEVLYPLPPFRQTPGPIQASQTYLQTLILEHWDAEIRRCEEACKAQLLERIQGPNTHQTFVREMIVVHWNAEKKHCEEACKV
ncbi:uncharacterized protein EDB93DRAFT_1245996 [Suillus bovinus]|uniref:uncharacterized protein n=1 Tax=Suillus bovinus TaxID=48563 RepID=UPI001B886DAD|nr:uncharacterized protein EDB93DRAFT_1245996 [Suillus bovinus]KAG2158761.1 hypothetical protein EDB93DRAFT_1245996 [Suillus bovinus]